MLADVPVAGGKCKIDLAAISHFDHDHIGPARALFDDRSLALSFGDIWFNAPPLGAAQLTEKVSAPRDTPDAHTDPDDTRIPDLARQALRVLVEQLEACGERLSAIEATPTSDDC